MGPRHRAHSAGRAPRLGEKITVISGSDDRDDDPVGPGECAPQDRPDVAADIGVFARVRDELNQAVNLGNSVLFIHTSLPLIIFVN